MHVIIIGGGIAGLTSAAAISKFCDTVTIVEKDKPPTKSFPRRYAPQGAHIHILLQAGLDILEKLLPGIHQQLVDGGASEINAGTGQQIFEYGAWRPSRPLDMYYLGQSRLLLETILYERIKDIPNVHFIKDRVESLQISSSNQLTGVNLKSTQSTIDADLIIDASGVSGVFHKWFMKNEISNIKEEKCPINIFYSTLHFKKPKEYLKLKENILIVPEAGVSNVGGSLLDIENDSWCISLHGRDGVEIPENITQWREAIKSLPDEKIWERIKNAEPISTLKSFKKSHAVWRRYDQCDDLPTGYIPIGDSINSLNPIFGQGMTITIGHVESLYKTCLEVGISEGELFRRKYLDRAHQWTSIAWKKSVAFDKNFLSGTKRLSKHIELLRKLTAAQHKKISESEAFHLKIVKDTQMLN